ncbi:hypothetical protein KRR40_12470 [Niabella defluvii]|nr:hypothetical protein KRR40_12470 [Niabella sp. I65]
MRGKAMPPRGTLGMLLLAFILVFASCTKVIINCPAPLNDTTEKNDRITLAL